ncbi:hypothetical protein [Massilimicrobiota timonensis]|uniref:Uncharacterized protein n=1 Tax=Massilimicrobiota timonensis TaxID=1776392 RepID=A0A1Y4STK3_9FIRM|nr:hypothetical protein [Massilimicrobiota timonensis]OUQ33249.1 hypothetical protein B5E75_10950 [Massilimicrobiota timonensis]
MARKAAEKSEKEIPKFSKEAIINSKTFKPLQDALNVILKDEEKYSINEVTKLLDDFMKGKVK